MRERKGGKEERRMACWEALLLLGWPMTQCPAARGASSLLFSLLPSPHDNEIMRSMILYNIRYLGMITNIWNDIYRNDKHIHIDVYIYIHRCPEKLKKWEWKWISRWLGIDLYIRILVVIIVIWPKYIEYNLETTKRND